MTDDLISRARAIEVVKAMVHAPDVGNDAATFGCMVWGVLVRLPAVDSGPVRHGYWYKPHGMMPPEHHHRRRCSACDEMAPFERPGREWLSDYCPSCGAKMDGGSE